MTEQTSRKVWTSDLHFDHTNAIKFCGRPWATVDEMNDGIINNFNSKVRPGDTVYILGDLYFGKTAERLDGFLSRLNGNKILILGNHDYSKFKDVYRRNFVAVKDYDETYITVDGIKTKVVMSHYPMLAWNGQHRGSIMLHGHCHSNMRYPFINRIMDVGVDAQNWFPVTDAEIWEKLKDIKPEILDNHGKRSDE